MGIFRKIRTVGDGTSLGEILVSLGMVTTDIVTHAANVQSGRHDRQIGQILVDLGAITQSQLELALVRQQQMRGETPDYVGASSRLLSVANEEVRKTVASSAKVSALADDLARIGHMKR